jgi:CPA2 family monovalent cation:H+ antiporter-2
MVSMLEGVFSLAQAAAPVSAGVPRSLLIDLLIILATAGLVAIVMQRLRFETVPAYLIAGALIGPNALSIVNSAESTEAISGLAIILLMFGIGLSLDLSSLRLGIGAIIGAMVASSVLCVLAFWPLGLLFGLNSPEAIAIGMALTITSTAVVVRVLSDRRQMRSPTGRLTFGILVSQDMMAIAMLATIPILAKWAGVGAETVLTLATDGATVDANTPAGAELMSEEPAMLRFLFEAALRIGGIAMLILAGKLLLPRLLAEAARGKSIEIMLVLATAAALGAAGITSLLGFSREMGAFLAGLLLSSTPFRHQLAGQVGPLRDLFMAVFFTTVGMKLDPHALADGWWLILIATGVMIVVKIVLMGASAWAFGVAASTSVAAGFALANAGEFSLVMLGTAASAGVLDPDVNAKASAVVALSLILIPLQMSLGNRVACKFSNVPPPPWIKRPKFVDRIWDRLARREGGAAGGAEPEADADVDHSLPARRVILAGYGLVGRVVAEQLDKIGVTYTIVEMNPRTVDRQAKFKKDSVYGDISNPEVLERAGIRDADAVIITIPDEEAVLRACSVIRKIAPKIFIAVRTNFFSKAMLATEAGADLVTVEEWATAQQMAAEVAKKLGREAPRVAAPKAERIAEEAEIEGHA